MGVERRSRGRGRKERREERGAGVKMRGEERHGCWVIDAPGGDCPGWSLNQGATCPGGGGVCPGRHMSGGRMSYLHENSTTLSAH